MGENLDSDGRVKVDEYFRVEGHYNVYALGDIANVPEAKQGTFAQEHARRTAYNLKRVLRDEHEIGRQKAYVPGPEVLIVALGRHNGLAQTPYTTFTGIWPTMVKSKGLFVDKVRNELEVTWRPAGFGLGVQIRDMIYTKRIGVNSQNLLDQ